MSHCRLLAPCGISLRRFDHVEGFEPNASQVGSWVLAILNPTYELSNCVNDVFEEAMES